MFLCQALKSQNCKRLHSRPHLARVSRKKKGVNNCENVLNNRIIFLEPSLSFLQTRLKQVVFTWKSICLKICAELKGGRLFLFFLLRQSWNRKIASREMLVAREETNKDHSWLPNCRKSSRRRRNETRTNKQGREGHSHSTFRPHTHKHSYTQHS